MLNGKSCICFVDQENGFDKQIDITVSSPALSQKIGWPYSHNFCNSLIISITFD